MAEIALGRVISGTREISSDTLIERAACAATGLGELGIGAGDAIGVVLRNDFAFFEASCAARRLGAHSVPVNWHGKAPEIANALNDCAAKAVVAHADLLAEVALAVPPGVPLFVVPTPPEIATAYGIAEERCAPPPDALQWDDLVTCFSPPPEPPASAQPFEDTADQVFAIAPDQEVRTVVAGQLYCIAPDIYALCAVRTGGLAVLQPRFDGEELLSLIERHRITHLQLTPKMLAGLLRLPEEVRRRCDLSSLDQVVVGSLPCPHRVMRAMTDWWGPVFQQYRGASEIGITTPRASATRRNTQRG